MRFLQQRAQTTWSQLFSLCVCVCLSFHIYFIPSLPPSGLSRELCWRQPFLTFVSSYSVISNSQGHTPIPGASARALKWGSGWGPSLPFVCIGFQWQLFTSCPHLETSLWIKTYRDLPHRDEGDLLRGFPVTALEVQTLCHYCCYLQGTGIHWLA